jgi:hypothetical protein
MPLFVWSVCRYFVIANAIAAAYNLLVLLVRRRRTTASLVVRMLDMVMIVFSLNSTRRFVHLSVHVCIILAS